MTQPPPLNYATPIPPLPKPPITRFWLKFFIGLLGGGAVSALAWWGMSWNSRTFENLAPFLLFGLPAVKLAAGITLTCIRRWRPLGIGLLIAIPLGFLILFFGCMAEMTYSGAH